MMHRRLAGSVLAAMVLACGAGGCGSSPPFAGRAPEQTVREFLRAVAARDGRVACRLLHPAGKLAMARYPTRAVGPRPARACEQHVTQLDRLPGWPRWRAYAHGAVTLGGTSAGLDAQNLTITYRFDGVWQQASTSTTAAAPGVDSLMVAPPRPPEADESRP